MEGGGTPLDRPKTQPYRQIMECLSYWYPSTIPSVVRAAFMNKENNLLVQTINFISYSHLYNSISLSPLDGIHLHIFTLKSKADEMPH